MMISERDDFKNTLTVTTAVFGNRFSCGNEENNDIDDEKRDFICIDR